MIMYFPAASQLPGLGRPALVELGLAVVADAGPLSASARKQAPGARRSASMGSQALQSSMTLRDPRLLNGVAESQVQ